MEGTVEVTPLTNAAGKGLDDMVRLLLDNGANINYLCSVRNSSILLYRYNIYVIFVLCMCVV